MNSFIITSTGITLYLEANGAQHTIPRDHKDFGTISKLATQDRFDEILPMLNLAQRVRDYVYASKNGKFKIDGTVLIYKDEEMHSYLASRMVDMALDGLDISAMEAFMENLLQNDSYRAVNELYGFLEEGNLPITPDGHFLAYKRVRDDYKDCHSGKIDNSVGQVVTMNRNEVDDDKDRTCSRGLHFCSYDYLGSFGGERVMVLKINPRDVVSIPSDYNNTKGRCCRYEVIREIEMTDEEIERIEGLVSHDGTYDDVDETGAVSISLDVEYEDEYEDDTCIDCDRYDEDCECSPEPEFYLTFEDVENEATTSDENNAAILAYKVKDTSWSRKYENEDEASADTGVPVEYIRRVIRGDRNSSYGFVFEDF